MSHRGEFTGTNAEENNNKRNMTRKNEPSYRKKGLSVFLTVIMVLSVVAMTAAFGGVAAAASHSVDEDGIIGGPTQIDNETVEVVFNESVDHLGTENFSVYNWEEENLTIGDAATDRSDNRMIISLEDELIGGNAYLEVNGENVSIDTTSTTVEADGPNLDTGTDRPFAGEQLALNSTELNDVLTITHPGGERERGTAENSSVRVLDTSEWEPGDELSIHFEEAGEEVNVTLRSLGLEAEVTEDFFDHDEDVTVDVSADRVNKPLAASLYDEDAEEIVAWETGNTGADAETTLNFGSQDEGNYSVTVHEERTWISDTTDQFEVGEEPEPVDFEILGFDADSYEEERGDILTFGIEIDNPEEMGAADEFVVEIEEDDYWANLTITDVDLDEDDDVLEINWNTYLAGGSDAGEGTVDDDEVFWSENATVEIHNETAIAHDDEFRLETDLYFAQVWHDREDPRIDSANIHIQDRHTGDVVTSIAPYDSVDADEDTIEHILANSSEFNDVAMEDLLIFDWEVSGIFGYFNDTPKDVAATDFNFSDEVSFEANFEDAPQRYQPTDADTFNETSDAVGVLFDEDANQILVVVNTSGVDELNVNQEWTANFTVDSDIADDDVGVDFETLERDFDFNTKADPPMHVVPEENSTIYGTTTVAPGTEIEGELDFRPIDRLDLGPVYVEYYDGERVWVFEEDFSDFEDYIDETFDLTAEGPHADDEAEIEGVWNMTHEQDRVTVEEERDALRSLVDEIKELLGVDDDDEILDAIEALQDDVETLQNDVDELESQVSDLEDEVAAWQDASEADSPDELEDLLDELREAAQDYMTLYNEAQDEIEDWQAVSGVDTPDELQELLDGLNDEIDDLNSQIDDLEQQIQDLQEDDDDDDDDDQPAFGPVAALLAILAGGALVARRRLN